MIKIKYIDLDSFLKRYKANKIDLIKKDLFSQEEIVELQNIDKILSMGDKINTSLSYLRFSLTHPLFIKSFLIPAILNKFFIFSERNNTQWSEGNIVKTNNLKATIAKAFNPGVILEIGTYIGVGAASFKTAIPDSEVITMSPRSTKSSNNPVHSKYVGYFFRKKRIDIKQIWADSTKYDYKKLGKVDFCYIDGNHTFEYVYSDLKNTSKITIKCLLVDDYIPREQSKKMNLVYGPWNDGVVRATDKFLDENPKMFKEAYWIKGTKFCILIKSYKTLE